MKKFEYCVRTFNGHNYEFITLKNKRLALKIAKEKEKELETVEVIVIKNIVGDDFGIEYPNDYGIIKIYYSKDFKIKKRLY